MQIDIFLHLQLFLFANVLPFTFHTNASSSHQRCSLKKGVLRNFSKFTGKQLRHGLFLNKLAGLRLATLLKKSLWYKCFPVNFAKFLRKPFLQNTSRWLLLNSVVFQRIFCKRKIFIGNIKIFYRIKKHI